MICEFTFISNDFVFQVAVGGRNKYLINGSNCNNQKVHDLFRSVQMNINNPHFLIMQGRITKVLNMKPPEVGMKRCHALSFLWFSKKNKQTIVLY